VETKDTLISNIQVLEMARVVTKTKALNIREITRGITINELGGRKTNLTIIGG